MVINIERCELCVASYIIDELFSDPTLVKRTERFMITYTEPGKKMTLFIQKYPETTLKLKCYELIIVH